MFESPASENLQRLLRVRVMMLAIFTGVALYVERLLDLTLPLVPLALVMAGAFAVTLSSWLWQARNADAVGSTALALQLLIDIAILTLLLYFTGGWTNPLVSLYLVPIAVSAAILSTRTTWLLAGLAVLAYSALTRFHHPLLHIHDSGSGGFTLHVIGMWLTFVICAGLLAYFGTSMATSLRRRDRALAAAREANLRNEQIIGVASLAAGTAHELSTPLASIAVIASELRDTGSTESRPDVELLLGQVTIARDILNRLREAAAPQPVRIPGAQLLDELAQRFQLLRPAVRLRFSPPSSAPDPGIDARPVTEPEIESEPTLQQALLNLLDNAADASPDAVELTGRWRGSTLEIEVLDRGPGLDATHGDAPRESGAPRGLGMGLLLANATIERRGGTVYASPRAGGGTRIRVTLPAAHDPIGEDAIREGGSR